MASIGSVNCLFVKGTLPLMRQESEVWRVPGIDGYGIALTGRGDSRAKLVAIQASDNAGVNLWAANLQALQGQIVSVTNDDGDSYAYCFIEKVGNLEKVAARVPGSPVTRRGEIEVEAILL